jgi:hypothetical protein
MPVENANVEVTGVAAVSAPDADGTGQQAPTVASPEIRAVCSGSRVAAQIVQILSRSPLFRDRLVIHRVDPDTSIESVRGHLPDGWLETADIYFEESMIGDPNTRRAIRTALPERCDVRTFATPTMRCLWPFLSPGNCLVPEPPTYNDERYANPNRTGARPPVPPEVTDDALFDAYMAKTSKVELDLDADLAADVARWEADDSRHDVKLTSIMRTLFREERVFVAPPGRGTPLVRAIIDQLLETPALLDVFDPDKMREAIDHITHNWSAFRQELPVHPLVAAHFGLTWWSPDLHYRILGNRFTFRDYIVHYARWSPWMR